ncbi:hypothetical protein PTTG_05855 [Puccinia triticina 1-1 BBBD Race 1]|uniref:Uncharacterized protein n=2 Tax=Puccinia triticina TaxID=208348 RepID=A0A0C4EYF5_PUCT1|nr:uncharacterized protein PtA15_6A388 [Puccinia triticina]OAV89586.1 hypothetical protein PTTG_05855 [Puccinia triticina 1-1 BBBD Race 1]WAQ85759.1 hypothetical protein PtA15_6A388 [Puccinia triticina]WAR55636.1 hypothetical protein PtB15_6B379 [Puccinia triticina]
MSTHTKPISASHSNSTTSTPKQRHLAHLATRLAELSIQTDRLASLCKIHARQSTDQRELAIYYGSMLMATTRVFNLDDTNESESEEEGSSPN